MKLKQRRARTRKVLTYSEKDDIEILALWGYGLAYIAKRVLGSPTDTNIRRVQNTCSAAGISVRDYRRGVTALAKSNATQVLAARTKTLVPRHKVA